MGLRTLGISPTRLVHRRYFRPGTGNALPPQQEQSRHSGEMLYFAMIDGYSAEKSSS